MSRRALVLWTMLGTALLVSLVAAVVVVVAVMRAPDAENAGAASARHDAAQPAFVDDMERDQAFLEAYRSRVLPNNEPDAIIIDRGRSVCSDLHQSASVYEVYQDYYAAAYGDSEYIEGVMVTSIDAYCPEFRAEYDEFLAYSDDVS